jgi:hypothetical protein
MYGVQCGSVYKSGNFEKRVKDISELSNPKSLNGSPTDSEIDFK